jgi:signal transduction histidine kinase
MHRPGHLMTLSLTDALAVRFSQGGVESEACADALEAQLSEQRTRLVRTFSFGLAFFGAGSSMLYLVLCARSADSGLLASLVTLHAGVLGASGVAGATLCQWGRLRAATYLIVLALILTATANLALIRNAEGPSVITYCVSVCIAALVLEGRELLRLAIVASLFALVGALLHGASPVVPVVLPQSLALGSLVVAATLGLAFPTGMLFLFSTNLAASRAEALDLARCTAEGNRLMADHAAELQARTIELEAKNAEMNDFLYVISHDLRAPLINVEGFSRALQDSVGTLENLLQTGAGNGNGTALVAVRDVWPMLHGEINESIDFIGRSVAKMDALVRGLLELSRIDTRPGTLQDVDLAASVAEVLGPFQFRIAERGIEVRADPLPAVRGDALRLGQVFGNLIDNAVKYSKPRGEALIDVGCHDDGDAYRFFVRDNGIGIKPKDQSKIFRIFARVTDNGESGEGLGLTAVKKIVEKHGGRIWVESEFGEGSTFWFVLPKRRLDGRMMDDETASGADPDLAGRG